jgi:hypothetical protein
MNCDPVVLCDEYPMNRSATARLFPAEPLRLRTYKVLIASLAVICSDLPLPGDEPKCVSSDRVVAFNDTLQVLPCAGKTELTVKVCAVGETRKVVYIVPLTELGKKVELSSYGRVTQLQAIGWYGGLMVAAKAESLKDDTATFIRIEIPKDSLERRTERLTVNGRVIRMFTASKDHDLLGLTKPSGHDNLVVMAGVIDVDVDFEKQGARIVKPVIYYSSCVVSNYDYPGI